ncbi:MAG: hypothetical protein ACK57V_19415 [Pirellula sp.]|jgi:hypothetical protein
MRDLSRVVLFTFDNKGRYSMTGFNTRGFVFCCWCSFCSAFLGCSSGEVYYPISGLVTVDDQPLKKGVITLFPIGTGTTVGGEIVDGKFSLPADKGPSVGKYRVEIVAFKTSGKKEFDVDLNKQVDVEVQYLPAKYNTNSTLDCEVSKGSNNEFQFNLNSK